MEKPVTADEILDRWAKKPLDFEPGTRWQYSNTNFVIAGRIVEHVAGVPFFDFLSKRILQPLGMTSAINLADQTMGPQDAGGYTRFAWGPARPVQVRRPRLAVRRRRISHDGARSGALGHFADGAQAPDTGLHGTTDHARSACAMARPPITRSGIGVYDDEGHPRLQHGGAVSGFVSRNTVWPDQRAAVVVFANEDGSEAPASVTNQIAPLLLAEADDPDAAPALAQARKIFDGLLEGKIDP